MLVLNAYHLSNSNFACNVDALYNNSVFFGRGFSQGSWILSNGTVFLPICMDGSICKARCQWGLGSACLLLLCAVQLMFILYGSQFNASVSYVSHILTDTNFIILF